MIRSVMICLMCSLLAGCTSSRPVASRPEWKVLLGNDSKAALAALHKLDGQIQKGMSEGEVLALFPSGVLVKHEMQESRYSFSFSLRSELRERILAPHSWGVYGYSIVFGSDERVLSHMVMLGGDI